MTLRGKKEISSRAVRDTKVVVERLPSLFAEFKAHRSASLPLTDRCAVNSVSVRSNVLNSNSDDIATA